MDRLQWCTVSLTICLGVLSGTANGDELVTGKVEYTQPNYQQATAQLDKVIEQQPNNATAYYYRANTFYKLGLKTKALLDYQHAYKLTTSPVMRGYCQSAISSLMTNTGVSTLNKTSSSYDNNSQEQVIQSLRTIQMQTAMDKVRIIDTGELYAQDHTLKEQLRVAQLQRETARNLEEMQNAFYYDRLGRKVPMYSEQDIQRYTQIRQEQENVLTKSIQKSTQMQTQSSRQQAQLTQEAAANLASQLRGNYEPNGVRLDPLGTNLYVRNYDVTNSNQPIPKPPAELLAKEKKLLLPKTSATEIPKETEIKTETVHGKLLN